MVSKIFKISSTTCGPCRQLKKELEGFSIVPVIEVDADDECNDDILNRYNVRGVPTLIFVDENLNLLDRISGFVTKQTVENKIKELNNK